MDVRLERWDEAELHEKVVIAEHHSAVTWQTLFK